MQFTDTYLVHYMQYAVTMYSTALVRTMYGLLSCKKSDASLASALASSISVTRQVIFNGSVGSMHAVYCDCVHQNMYAGSEIILLRVFVTYRTLG